MKNNKNTLFGITLSQENRLLLYLLLIIMGTGLAVWPVIAAFFFDPQIWLANTFSSGSNSVTETSRQLSIWTLLVSVFGGPTIAGYGILSILASRLKLKMPEKIVQSASIGLVFGVLICIAYLSLTLVGSYHQVR